MKCPIVLALTLGLLVSPAVYAQKVSDGLELQKIAPGQEYLVGTADVDTANTPNSVVNQSSVVYSFIHNSMAVLSPNSAGDYHCCVTDAHDAVISISGDNALIAVNGEAARKGWCFQLMDRGDEKVFMIDATKFLDAGLGGFYSTLAASPDVGFCREPGNAPFIGSQIEHPGLKERFTACLEDADCPTTLGYSVSATCDLDSPFAMGGNAYLIKCIAPVTTANARIVAHEVH